MSASEKDREAWTDEQAADAVIGVLSDDFTVGVLRSWFKPRPYGDERAGPSEWVALADHSKGMLMVGRAILDLQSDAATARAEGETAGYRKGLEDAAKVMEAQAFARECADDTMRGVRDGEPYRNLAAAIRKLGEGA